MITQQTKSNKFGNLKYTQKLEISYEFGVRLIFTPMYGGFTDCAKHASAAALYSSTTDILLAFHTNKTKQHLQK